MIIHRDGWRYSGRVPEFFTGQAGCFCCPAGGGVVYVGGVNTSGGIDDETRLFDGSSWSAKTVCPSTRFAFGGCTLANKAYFACGQNSALTYLRRTDEYTPDTWTNKTDCPTPARTAYDGFAEGNGKGYLMCGLNSTPTLLRDTDEYDQSANTWASKTDAPTPARQLGSTSTIGTAIAYFGGSNALGLSETAIADTDTYESTTDTWTSRTDMPATVRMRSSASEISGTAYLAFGGAALSSAMYGETDSYTIDTWTAKTSSIVQAQERASSTLSGAHVCVGGATLPSGIFTTIDDADSYTPDTWTAIASDTAIGRSGAATTVT